MALAFGTSGIRGLAIEFTDSECDHLVHAFLEHLKLIGKPTAQILIAGDYRASTPEILCRIEAALRARNAKSTFCGIVPTPALAYACIERQLPGIMVTGSHIPADRNGIKFYFETGEILKKDEASIFKIYQETKTKNPNPKLALHSLSKADPTAATAFINRYVKMFPPKALDGVRVLFYEHSTVAKNALPQILTQLGATVTHFGATTIFTPVDTEAVENADELKAKMLEARADALVSADGDGDRPMMIADNGDLIPGDTIGLIAAKALKAEQIVVPVSCNTALEASHSFKAVHRTKIGSPFVLEKMIQISSGDPTKIAGFEANGGFFYTPLLTRDCILPVVLVLAEMKYQSRKLSELLAQLPPRFTHSGLIRGVPPEKSQAILNGLKSARIGAPLAPALERFGIIKSVDQTDGMRFTLHSSGSQDKTRSGSSSGLAQDAIIHFRPSGNAPEFRVYSEHATKKQARELCEAGLSWLKS